MDRLASRARLQVTLMRLSSRLPNPSKFRAPNLPKRLPKARTGSRPNPPTSLPKGRARKLAKRPVCWAATVSGVPAILNGSDAII